jgi:hypothetical protein
MAKHSYAPWKAQTSTVVDASGYYVCELSAHGKSEQVTLANAKLIAAAPDLLAALTAIVISLVEQDDEGMLEHAQQMIDASAAIAKATQ